MLPSGVDDRRGWARDIQVAFTSQTLSATRSNICSVIAVVAQESSFEAQPVVPGLAHIARSELERRATAAHVPGFVLSAALELTSSNGKTYNQRLDSVRTERQLSDMFEDFIGRVPLGKSLFGRFNPVHTGGPMQVAVDFAEAHDSNYPYADVTSVRSEVFSRRGGLYFGILHLLGYGTDYPSPLYRFADYNAGWYASRNAAFQRAVSQLTGIKLALDGDLVSYHSTAQSHTERATKTLSSRIDLSEGTIRRDLTEGEKKTFSDTKLYKRVFALADSAQGHRVPRAILPGIRLESPKITRKLTTAWFAKRVDARWKACMRRVGNS
jgi:hypothetical protein